MKKLYQILTLFVIVIMSGIVCAEQEEWAYGQRNVVPYGIEYVMYNFEEGTNCGTFNNQYPDVAEFMNVSGTQPYGVDVPSYSRIGGTTCGSTRCKMYIYPSPNTYYNGTPKNWIYVVNGRCGFNSITCCNSPDCWLGDCWPGTRAYIATKKGTNYISFLVSTGGTMYFNLYDHRGNRLHSEKVYANYHRNGTEPSDFTRVSVYLPDKDIRAMTISGMFNGWIIDDMVIGEGNVYERRDYGYAAERMKEILGAKYLEHGHGYDLAMGEYVTAEEILNDVRPYINMDTGELEFGEGIYDEDAILWAFNENEDLINWKEINRMEKQDFKEEVAYEDIQPGDVFFIDYPSATGFPDGCYDEVGIVIEPTTIDGETYDIIRIIPGIPDGGVSYDKSSSINDVYGTYGFVDYRCLPDSPKGGHSPYPKAHSINI